MSKKLYAVLVVKYGMSGQGENGVHDIVFVGAGSKEKAISKIATYKWSDPLWTKKSKCMVVKAIEITDKGLLPNSVHTINVDGLMLPTGKRNKKQKVLRRVRK